ncbi:hypothetical protein [Streptomyces sp. STR69]|uniref:hypothetical protein n=1 Tax=Streptomyces sp. STR69 TaxID=1796942 RepID=UPI0021C698A5|nr:hypothetical protein [Streptomyces sp. STR69]
MTITEGTAAVEDEVPTLGQLLVQSARAGRDRIAAQALADEGTILAQSAVRAVLVAEEDGAPICRWEGLMGRLYGLGLDDHQRAFLGLVLSIVGIGHITLAVVPDLDERRMLIVQRTILRLAGNDRVAIGPRL